MNRIIAIAVILIWSGMFSEVWGQKVGTYVFARNPQLMNYNFESGKASYSEGVSAGIGLYRKSMFLEFATIIFEGDSYGYYTFFGSTIKSTDLGGSFKLNTNVFGEIATLPSQPEVSDALWIFTSGICFFPNVQIQKLNAGIAICSGIAYQDSSFSFNNRFIMNLSYSLIWKKSKQ
ncbi:MAG: hypothetical protein JXR03_02980 [Cyclobacteriaceae bacterium]